MCKYLTSIAVACSTSLYMLTINLKFNLIFDNEDGTFPKKF